MPCDGILLRIKHVRESFTRPPAPIDVSKVDLRGPKNWVYSHFVNKLKYTRSDVDPDCIESLQDNQDNTGLHNWLSILLLNGSAPLLGTFLNMFVAFRVHFYIDLFQEKSNLTRMSSSPIMWNGLPSCSTERRIRYFGIYFRPRNRNFIKISLLPSTFYSRKSSFVR